MEEKDMGEEDTGIFTFPRKNPLEETKDNTHIAKKLKIPDEKYSNALTRIITRDTDKTDMGSILGTLPSNRNTAISDLVSTSSISSIASSTDIAREKFNEKIGELIKTFIKPEEGIAQNYVDQLNQFEQQQKNEDEALRGIIESVDKFVIDVKNIAESTDIDSLKSTGVELVKRINTGLNTKNPADPLYEYMALLRRKVNVNLVQLRHIVLKTQQAQESTKDPANDPLNYTIAGLGLLYNGLSYAVSNSLISLYFIKKNLTSLTTAASDAVNSKIDAIITNAEETIFEVMNGPMGDNKSELTNSTANYTRVLNDRFVNEIPSITDQIELLITSVSEYINNNQNEFDDSEFLYNLYAEVQNGGHVNFLNKGNDALFLFMEYMREHPTPIINQIEISGDVVATMIQLLSLNGEKVALTGVSATNATIPEGHLFEASGKGSVPVDEPLTQESSQPPESVFSFAKGGGRRTRRRGVRRSIKSNKKSKRARGRKTRRAKRKQSTERRRR